MARFQQFFKIWMLGCLAASTIGFLPTDGQARDCVDYYKAGVQRKRYRWLAEPDANGKGRVLELCAPAASHKVFEGLIALDELGPLTNEVDGLDRGLLGRDVARFFPDRISEIDLEERLDSGCFDGVNPLAFVKTTVNLKRVHICPSFAHLSTLMAMATLIHEARHGDKESPLHTYCIRGAHLGQISCDSSYEAGGAYGVEAEFLLRVARTRRLPKALRQEARSKLLITLFSHFNVLPSVLKPNYLLQDLKGSVYLADTNGKINWLFNTTGSNWIISKVKYFPVAVNLNDGGVLRYSYLEGEEVHEYSLKDFNAYFNEPRRSLKDLTLAAGYFYCFLFDSEVECRTSKKPFRRSLNWTEPAQLGSFNNMLSFTAVDGSVYYYPFDVFSADDSVKVIGEKSGGFRKLPTEHKYRSFFELEAGRYIGLNMKGQVVKVEGKPQGNPVLIESLKKYAFKRAVGPITWSSELEEL